MTPPDTPPEDVNDYLVILNRVSKFVVKNAMHVVEKRYGEGERNSLISFEGLSGETLLMMQSCILQSVKKIE